MEKVVIEKFEGSELTILTGAAHPFREPNKITITGDIKAVNTFLGIRNTAGKGVQEIDKSKAIIVMNKKEKTIKLMVDPENYYGATVTGTLEDSEELKPFAINTTSTFDKKQLVQLLKFNKAYFNEPDKHANTLLAFQKLESTIAVTANDSANDCGNKEKVYKKDVTTNAPTEFVLTIPIFKGFPPQTFRVEICLDITDGGAARFWFESVELDTIKKSQIDEIFDTETANASDFVIINQ